MEALGVRITIGIVAGTAIGIVHFAGLWWTVRWTLASPNPALVAVSSYVVRMGATLGAFYLLMDGDWIRLIALAAGFTLARLALGSRSVNVQRRAP